jgi:hypothetical protein
VLEDWLDSLEPEGGCHMISNPEEACQHDLQLGGAGVEPAQEEMTGSSMS